MPELFSQILDLKEKDVFLETEVNDTRYFSVTGLPSTLSYGKHPFSITFNDPEGQPLLKNLSNIIFEFVDSRGVVIFSNLINISELSGAGNGFVWIKKDPLRTSDEIADGPAFFYVMGELDGSAIPNDWKGIYNVRSTFEYDIRKDYPNTSPLILKSPIDIQTNLNISESIDFDSEDDVFKRSFININLSDLETNGGEISNVELSYNEQNASTEDFNIITSYTLDSGSFETIDQTATSGLNPITNTTKVEIPNEFRRNTPVKFKLRFQNPAGQFAQHLDEDRQGQIIEVTSSFISFEGAPIFIEKEDNLLSGSLFTGNAVGKGFEQSGKGSAFLKTVDYDGFISASAGSGSAGILFFSGSVFPNSGDNYDGVGLELHGGKGSGSFRFRTNPSLLEIEANTFFIGNETTQFVSGSNSNIEISSSLFHLDPKNELLVIGTDAIINADLTVTNIRTPATIAGAPSTDQNASSSITSQGFAKFVSASIGGFDVGEGGFSLGSTNVNIDSLNKAITINNGTFGQTGVQLDYNGGTPRAFIGKSSGEFFKFDGSSVNISSSAFFLGSSEQFVSGSNGNIEISSSNFHLDPSNNIMIMSGTIQASDGNIGDFQIIDGKISGSNITFDANNSSIFKTDQGPGSDTSAAFDQLRNEYYIDFTPSSSTDPEGTEYYIKMGPNFMVDKSGILIASGAFFEGTVSASAGFLGGFVIESSSIHSRDFSVSISGSPTSDGFFISSSNFNIKGNGNVTGSSVNFTGGDIAGWTINADTIQKINSDGGVKIDSSEKAIIVSHGGSEKVRIGDTSGGDAFGIKGIGDGGDTLFVLGAEDNLISDWSISETKLAKGTDIVLDAQNKRISLNNNAMAFGFEVAGTGKHGLHIDATNHIYSTGEFIFGSTGSNGQFISASNGNIEISSSNFHLDAAGNVDMSGTITATSGEIGGFTIGDDLSSTSGTLKLKGASGQITGSSVLFTGGKIAGFTISGDTLTATNFTLDASGKRITLGSSNTIFIADADEGIQLGNATFSSAPFSVTTAGVLKATSGTIGGFTLSDTTISSSGLLLESTGKISGSQVNFTGGTVGGFTLSDTQITSNNLIMDSVGTLRTSDYATNERGWRISSEGNGLAEFENVRIRGTLSTAVFEKETINAVGGQLYVANSTALTGSGLISASFTTMSVVNVTGFEQNEILSLKKQTNSGFLTEYILVNSSSRDDNTSETNFSGKLFVTRGYGSGSIGDSGSLGGTPQNSQSYEPGQVLVSTGKQGTGFIRLNANPNDSSTPYIDVVERTGNNIYDVELKARFGDLSGVAGTRNVPSDFTGFGLMSEVAFLSGSNIKLETPRFLLGDLTSAFVSGSNGNIEISSSNFHLTPEGSITASKGLLENVRIVGGAADNTITPFDFASPSFIGGGNNNKILVSENTFLGGGQNNVVSMSNQSILVGGEENHISGGLHPGPLSATSPLLGDNATIAGGKENRIEFGPNCFIGGGTEHYIGPGNTPVEQAIGSSNPTIGSTFTEEYSDGTMEGTVDGPKRSISSTIGGGASNLIKASENSTIAGGQAHYIIDSHGGTIAGGFLGKMIDGESSNILGGQNNQIISQSHSVVAGGEQNKIGENSMPRRTLTGQLQARNFIGGGFQNTIFKSQHSSILGGTQNLIDSGSNKVSILGGEDNVIATSSFSTIIGGENNNITEADHSIIGGGNDNNMSVSDKAFMGGGTSNIITDGKHSSIVAGDTNSILNSTGSFIGAGRLHEITSSVSSVLVGGIDNQMTDSDFSAILGGQSIIINNSTGSFIGAGKKNKILTAADSTIGGGDVNRIQHAKFGFIGGGSDGIISGSDFSFLGGGIGNEIFSASKYSVIGGGQNNEINNLHNGTHGQGKAEYSTIAGGAENQILAHSRFSSIGGGDQHQISASHTSVIGGGKNNIIQGNQNQDSTHNASNESSFGAPRSIENTIAGGGGNSIGRLTTGKTSLLGNTIAGGSSNHIYDDTIYSSILGGDENEIIESSSFATILGGQHNDIFISKYSFIAGGSHNRIVHGTAEITGNSRGVENANVILNGTQNTIASQSIYSIILNGFDNELVKGEATSIVGHQNETHDADFSLVVGRYNKTLNVDYGGINSGYTNTISSSDYGGILAGGDNVLKNGEYSIIAGGQDNHIESTAAYNGIFGGENNHIGGTLTDAFIIGSNISASLSNTTFVENLAIPATKKLFLDGGSNTYLQESSDGVIDVYGDNVHLISFKQNGTQSEVVVNEGSGDVDFRVEANNNQHAFFVEAEGQGNVEFRGTNQKISGSSTSTGSFGSLSLGESSHIHTLSIKGHSEGSTGIRVRHPSDDTLFEVKASEDDGRLRLFANNSRKIQLHANDVSYFNGGNVGIGTESPTARKLEVKDTSSNVGIRLTTGTALDAIIDFGDTDDGDAGRIQYDNNTDKMHFRTSGSNRLTIDSSGNVTPGSDDSQTFGSSSERWKDIFAVQTTTGGVFETGLKTEKIGDNPTGTIVSWRGDGLVPCDSNEDELVMGVIKQGKDEPIVMGAEPVLVTGKVEIGDYIVTSDKIGHGKAVKRGYLLKKDLFGKVIAQALEPSDDSDSCLIKCMIRKM